jgi:quercetin dioxygenase-like cupin family protein
MGGSEASWIAARGGTPVFEDARGRLTLVEFEGLRFTPARAYVLNAIPVGARRGGHASRNQDRFLVMLSGRARMTLDDGHHSEEIELAPGDTVHLGTGVWHQIEAIEENLAVLVLAEGQYDRSDYVSDRESLPLNSSTASDTAQS